MGSTFFKKSILTLMAILTVGMALPCSMYKVTTMGKTMVGNNEDSWGRDPRIWFEPGTNGKFGVVCVGYARKQPNPDGAMNEYGLAFDAFTMPHKSTILERDPQKKDFGYAHILTIMQQCKTVDEVYDVLKEMNLHVLNGSVLFNGGMLLFVDRTGKYLVVEASKMTFGTDDTFVLANFSIADTKDVSTVKMERYCKGLAYLSNKQADTSLSFCSALSDTMSVNRASVGDGTLYTTIYDLDAGLIHVYFYHDFSQRVTFNIHEELSKGAHAFDFATLFPGNANFQKFLAYKTPQNSKVLFAIIVSCSLLFFFTFIFFLIGFFRTSASGKYVKLSLSLLGISFSYYAYVLLRNEAIYYFPSPYLDRHSILVTLTSYLPFVLLVVIVPLIVLLLSMFRKGNWSRFAKGLFAINTAVYILLIGLFAYWNLFDVFT